MKIDLFGDKMSRLYDFEYEIKTKEELKDKILDALRERWCQKEDDDFFHDGVLTVSGETTLGGGMSAEEAHGEIAVIVKRVDPDARVITRWHFAEWSDWDDVFVTKGSALC